jgi:hypothetical protein
MSKEAIASAFAAALLDEAGQAASFDRKQGGNHG